MAIITSGITTLTDLNDAIISGTQPVNPTAGTLWIDSSKSPAVLKIFKNGAWVTQDLDLNSLDPDMAESIRNVVATIGNMSNDNLLDYKERQIIKDDLTDILGKITLDTETVLPTVAQLDSLAKGSFYTVRRNALNAGMETGNTIYVDVATQYQNLKTYLESLTPIKPWNVALADKDKNVTVVKNTFRDKWLQYYLATEKLSLATTEKIKEAQENLDGKIDEVSLRDKTEILSGNPVFTDKADDAVVHVEVDGLSEQVITTQSKNFFNGVFNSGFVETSSYNPTYSAAYPNSLYSDKIYVTVGTTYILSNVTDSDMRIRAFARDNSFVDYVNGFRYTVSSSVAYIVILWHKGLTTAEKSLNIQFEEGAVATSYVPFTGNNSPSPDYPSAINSLDKSFDIVSSVGGQNILKDTALTHTGKGSWSSSLVIKNDDGFPYVENGYSWNLNQTVPLVKAGTYSVSVLVKEGTKATSRVRIASGDIVVFTSPQLLTNQWQKIEYTFTCETDISNMQIYFLNGDSTGNALIKFAQFKLELRDTTPYSQAPEDISYNTQTPTLYKTNILLSEPLRSVGDVKDRLFLDTDGLWKVERNIGEYQLDGSENPIKSTVGTRWDINTVLPKNALYFDNNNTKTPMQSSHYANANGDDQFAEGLSYVYGRHIRIMSSIPKSASELKSFFASEKAKGTPITYVYVTAEKIIETLSAEQQTKLNNIQSFKGSNYVYTIADVAPNLNAKFKSNMWYRMNVLGEKQISGNRNWVTNGNLAYPLEKSLWSSYYKGTVKETVDISTEAPPFKNALHIKQTTNGVAGIIDAVIWEGAEANVLTGQNISMANWLKYQNVSNESLVMQVQVTGKTSSGLFSYDYPKVFSYTGTDLTWKRQTGTVKINLPDGAVEITRIAFRLGLASAGTGEFWATGIQLETGNALGDWSTNPNDTEEELNKTEARFILTEKEIGLSVKKGELINGVLVNGDGVKIDGRNVDINGLVTFGSFDTTTKNAIDAKATKTEAQSYANNAVNNLEIGGTNLLADTQSMKDSGNGVISGTYNGLTILRSASLTTGYTDTYTKKTIVAPTERFYTASFFAKASRNGVTIQNYFYSPNTTIKSTSSNGDGTASNDGTAYVGLTVEWKRYWITWEQTESSTTKTVIIGRNNGQSATVEIAGVKLETGTKSTDWSRAPEDTDVMIEKAQTDATNAKTSAGTAKSLADQATILANNASTLAGTKSRTFTTTPTTPYVSGDVWKNGTAVYISTANRASGTYVLADWVLVGDVTSANTANDVANVGGVASETVRDKATNGDTAYTSTSLWKSTNLTTINGGQITTDTVTSGAIKSDVALINKLFVSDANINALTAKTAFITAVKAQTIDVSKLIGETAVFVRDKWNSLNSNISIDSTAIHINNPSQNDKAMLQKGGMTFYFSGIEVGRVGLNYTQQSTEAYLSFSARNGQGMNWAVETGANTGVYDTIMEVPKGQKTLRMQKTLNLNGNSITEATSVYSPQHIISNGLTTSEVGKLFASGAIANLNANTQLNIQVGNVSKASLTSDSFNLHTGLNANGNSLLNMDTVYFGTNMEMRKVNANTLDVRSNTQLRLVVNGFTMLDVLRSSSTSTGINVYANFNMNGNVVTSQSDRRLKKIIETSTMSAIDGLRKWNFVNYEWRDDDKPKGIQFGLIAQDTPDLMVYSEEQKYYSIDISRQIMLNSKVGQELILITDEHKTRFTELEDKYKLLKEKIEKMESGIE